MESVFLATADVCGLQKHAARCLDSFRVDPAHFRRAKCGDDASDIVGFPCSAERRNGSDLCLKSRIVPKCSSSDEYSSSLNRRLPNPMRHFGTCRCVDDSGYLNCPIRNSIFPLRIRRFVALTANSIFTHINQFAINDDFVALN